MEISNVILSSLLFHRGSTTSLIVSMRSTASAWKTLALASFISTLNSAPILQSSCSKQPKNPSGSTNLPLLSKLMISRQIARTSRSNTLAVITPLAINGWRPELPVATTIISPGTVDNSIEASPSGLENTLLAMIPIRLEISAPSVPSAN